MTEWHDHLLVLDRPALLVGVTGYMKLVPDETVALREQVRRVLLFLRDGGTATIPPHPNAAENGHETQSSRACVADLLAEQLAPRKRNRRLHHFYRQLLRRWRPLANTPIVVLSALAPGADSIVADEALKVGLTVAAPLPFPADQYRESSSFVWKDATAGENEARQLLFDKLLERIGPANTFHVPLVEDQNRNETDRRAKSQEDLTAGDMNGKPRRHARYYAAGEYCASYSHLLLAIWDGEQEDSREGTSAVVQARLLGPRPGTLQTTGYLALPQGGPLLHLFFRKAFKTNEGETDLPMMRLLHPYSFESPTHPGYASGDTLAPRQHKDRQLQRERMATFFRLASNLERFNSQRVPPWVQRDRDQEFRKKRLVQIEIKDNRETLVPLAEEHPLSKSELVRGLRRVSDLRCAATEGNAWFHARTLATLRWLFALTLLAAVMLHVFAHWHLRPGNTKQGDKHGDATKAASEAEDHALDNPEDSHAAHHSRFRTLAGATAFALAIVALIAFAAARSQRFEEQADDARALGEGLRVQFYWNLAGLGRSVSANYMQRQGSELDWVRGAIRTVSMPYHWWADQFNQLSADQKIAALRCVEGGWIRDQLKYFEDAYHKRHHSLHGWHKLGSIISLAGLFSLATWWAGSTSESSAKWLETHRFLFNNWAVGLIALAVAWRLVVWCIQAYQKAAEATDREEPARKADKSRHHHGRTWKRTLADFKPPRRRSAGRTGTEKRAEPHHRFVPRCLAHWRSSALGLAMKLVDDLAPTLEPAAHSGAAGLGGLLMRSLYNFAAMIPLSLAMAGFTVFAILGVPEQFHNLPDAENLGIIVGGVLLLCGALSIAWAEKNLDSELGYQYNTMAGLFSQAAQWMTQELRFLDDLHSNINASAADSPEQQAAQANFDAAVHRVQEFLYALGKEALDENAEWLILHRARPLEPVMAG